MVFRKPYAFIIKHFRLIHLAILACLAFLSFSLNDINNLFTNLQRTNTLMYGGAGIYINNIVYVLTLIVIGLSFVVFWILRIKKKPTGLYLFLLIYSIALLIVYSYLYSLLGTMIDELVDLDTIILAKDISMITVLPSYIGIVICFIRGIGFNLKQFNFSKDLKELQIDEKDSEEIELTLGQNNYKYLRFIRRALREMKYYVLENIFGISCVSALLFIVLVIVGINYYNEYMKVLAASEATSVNGISYTVRNSYVTTKNSTGDIINNKYKYVVVDMSFYNSTYDNKEVDIDLITLSNGNLYYHPVQTKNDKFYDLGLSYVRGEVLESGETMNATLAFELPAASVTNNLQLKIRYAIENKVSSVISRYRNFDISPKKIDVKKSSHSVQVNQLMNINPVGINKFDLTIRGYKVLDIYDNKYVLCSNLDKCIPLSDVITPDKKEFYTMLELDYESILYEGNRFSETLNTYNKIFENYLTVRYTISGRNYSFKAKTIKNSDVDNKIFILCEREIVDADSIELIFNFRNDEYNIVLKND